MVTARHLVFVLPPLVYDETAFGPNVSFLDSHVWRPELDTRVLVVAKDDFSDRRWYRLPASFAFHFGNAWEDPTGNIRFDYCVAPDATVLTETLRYVMRGEFRPPTEPTRFAQVTLNASGDAVQDISSVSAEFPRVAPAVVGRRYRQVYALTGGAETSGLGRVARIDIEAGLADSFDYGDRFIPEEHVFVPRRGAADETDGWLVGTALDLRERVTRISVFGRFTSCRWASGLGRPALPAAPRISRNVRTGVAGGGESGGFSPALRPRPSRHLLKPVAQNVVQDASVQEALDLERRVEPADQRHGFAASVGADDPAFECRPGRDRAGKSGHVDGFRPVDAEGVSVHALRELKRQYAHAHEIGAVDTLESAGEDGSDAEEPGTAGRPISG